MYMVSAPKDSCRNHKKMIPQNMPLFLKFNKRFWSHWVNHIVLASHLCTCVLHRQLSQLHTLRLPKFFDFHRDFHQKWHFAHPKISFAHPELPFLAKSMVNHPLVMSISCQQGINEVNINQPGLIQGQKSISGQNSGNQGRNLWKLKVLQLIDALKVTITW